MIRRKISVYLDLKKNLFKEKRCRRKFYKRNFVGYWKFGTKTMLVSF